MSDVDDFVTQVLEAFPGSEVIPPAVGAGSPPACRYPEHRASDWIGEGGRRVCGVCHPRPAVSDDDVAPLRLADAASVAANGRPPDPGPPADLPPYADADAPPEGAGRLPWRWSQEIVEATPEEPGWLWQGYLARGLKTTAAGLPKAGKSTLAAALIEAIAGDLETFLGREVIGGPVLLLSEEGDGTLAPKLRGMPERRVRVLNRDAIFPKPSWAQLIADATREAAEIGAVLLVIDSLAFWAAFEPERENDAGATQAVMSALDEACRAGLAVLLIHHQRKKPGEHGTGIRGSGAGPGAVDVLVEFERLEKGAPSTQRRLVALSRLPQTPDVLVVDFDREGGTWRVVGEAEDRGGADQLGARERLLEVLPTEPPGESEDELCERVGVPDKRKMPLRELVKEGLVKREGRGVSGHPFTYWRTR
jgi:hypothetical protein